jgi:hypothetical protein
MKAAWLETKIGQNFGQKCVNDIVNNFGITNYQNPLI